MPSYLRHALALPLAVAVACSTATVATTTVPDVSAPAATPAPPPPPLPPIPEVDGPLAIRVVYPSANQVVTSKDSNFIFGSIGSGKASLTVNGVPARVYPNGAFMAFLANPPGDTPTYQLVARAARTRRA